MTWTSTLALCAASSAIVAVPLLFRLNAVKRDLATARQSANLFAAWWERDSGKMLVAQAELDLIREQRREAGRQSHKAERALFRETAERIAGLPAQPLRPRHEIEAEVAAIRAARKSVQPAASMTAPGFPAGRQRPEREGERGRETPRHTGQDTGAGTSPDVKQRARAGNAPGRSCRRNRAGNFAPAETPKQKGLANG